MVAFIAAVAAAIGVTVLELAVLANAWTLDGLDVIVALLTTLIGLPAAVIGLPLWAVLHIRGCRSIGHALFAGMAISGGGVMAIGLLPFLAVLPVSLLTSGVDLLPTLASEVSKLGVLFAFGVLPGAAGGAVFQLIAYRTRF
ncbi:hypothetical protein GCM10009422_05240 [Brevundimonas kwangchunensis]|uniref:Uncharacterized protein n=1 Tax=Brevundimonas kwangchunensis TaxID=322163 RepID=A0ABN1GK62_9CAUL